MPTEEAVSEHEARLASQAAEVSRLRGILDSRNGGELEELRALLRERDEEADRSRQAAAAEGASLQAKVQALEAQLAEARRQTSSEEHSAADAANGDEVNGGRTAPGNSP